MRKRRFSKFSPRNESSKTKIDLLLVANEINKEDWYLLIHNILEVFKNNIQRSKERHTSM